MARVILPTSMKAAAGGRTVFQIEAANMQEVLARLGADHPKLKPILDRGVDVYVYFKHEDDPAGIEYARILLRRLVVGWEAS